MHLTDGAARDIGARVFAVARSNSASGGGAASGLAPSGIDE